MDIDEIQTFIAIAELGGFTRAGRRLHRSQPAISRRLGILERDLGAPMFERIRGRARLTEAGHAFLPHAEAALAALKDGREAVRSLQTGMQGAISLALVGTLADTHVIDLLHQFAQRSKNVRLELRTASSGEVTDLPAGQEYLVFDSKIGIVATPVIDDATSTIYVVAFSKDGG